MAVAQVQQRFLERPFVRNLATSLSQELVTKAESDSKPLEVAKKIVASPANIGTTALGITAAFYIARNILNKAYSSSDSLIKTWLMPALLVFGGGVLKFLDVYGKRIRIKALEKNPLFKKYGTQIVKNLESKIKSVIKSKDSKGSSFFTMGDVDFVFQQIIQVCESDNALPMNNVGLKVYKKDEDIFLQTLAEGENSTCVVEDETVYGLETQIATDDTFETLISKKRDIRLISRLVSEPNSDFKSVDITTESINGLFSGRLTRILSVLEKEDTKGSKIDSSNQPNLVASDVVANNESRSSCLGSSQRDISSDFRDKQVASG